MGRRERFNYQDLDALRVGRFNLGINTTFVVYRLGATLIDTGPSNQWKYVREFVDEKPLRQLLLTHHHEDHSGNAAAISKRYGVKAMAPVQSIDKLRGFRIPPLQHIVWGASAAVDVEPLPATVRFDNGEAVKAIHAPGHARDMTCYLLPARGWLFSADMYIANHLKMLRIDEDVGQILLSIAKVLAEEFETIICPHRGVVENGKQRLQEKYNFLIDLVGEVQRLHQGGMSAQQICYQLLGKEGLMGRLSGYNFSKINLIRSSLEVSLP